MVWSWFIIIELIGVKIGVVFFNMERNIFLSIFHILYYCFFINYHGL